jgi:3-oxoacyl-[acyl-carrier protein] reductase
MNLKDKNIIVTGANRGIGFEIKEKLALQGDNIINCCRKETSEIIEYAKKFNKLNKNQISNFFFDLQDEKQIDKASSEILNSFKKIDGIINNAGVNSLSLFLNEDFDIIKKIFNVNFFSQLYFTKKFIKRMIVNKGGSIIFISSNAAQNNLPGRLSYCVSKSSIIHASRILAKELGPYQIRVNSIAPGPIETDMLKNQFNEDEIQTLKKENIKIFF